MKNKLIFLVLFLPFSTLIAQHHFKILGTSEFYNNQKLTIQPIQFNDIDFLDGKIELNKTQIEILHNNFNLSGKGNDDIQPLEVVYHDEQKNRFYVGVFFIDNISTTFEVNIPDLATDKTINVSNSKSQSEYNFILKKLAFEKIGVMPFDHNNLQKKNKFLHDYISMTPNSLSLIHI